MNQRPALRLVMMAWLQVSISGCGEKNLVPEVEDPVLVGWSLFAIQDYPPAMQAFEQAFDDADRAAEAHDGYAWSMARWSSAAYDSAQWHAEEAIDLGWTGPDAPILLLAIRLHQDEYGSAREWAGRALAADSLDDAIPDNYEFAHDSAVGWKTSRLIRARAAFYLGELEPANADICHIDSFWCQEEPIDPDFLLDGIEALESDSDPQLARGQTK